MNYQQIDAERIRKVKERQTSGNNSGNQGYSQTALSALAKGQYSNLKNNKSTSVPQLDGMSPVSVRKNTVQKTDSRIDTTRARSAYAKETGYKSIGRSLSAKDSDIIHSAIGDFGIRKDDGSFSENSLKNVAKTLGWQPDKEDELKKKYGKSTLDIVKNAARDWDKVEERKKKAFGEEHPIMSTLSSLTAEGIIKPLAGLASVTANAISPDSDITKTISSKARGVSEGDTNLRSGVTSDMGNLGKTVYNTGVDVGGRIIGNKLLTPAASGFRTAEQTRQSLEDRGITGRGATAQALGSGAIDALLDVYGLEKIKGIQALQGSGNLAKTILGSAIAGGGEQALTGLFNEALDRVANGQDSVYSRNVQNYMAQGLDAEDAANAALTDEVKTIIGQAGQGLLFGAAMGGGKQILGRGINALSGTPIPKLEGTIYDDGQSRISKLDDGFGVEGANGAYKVNNIDQALRLVDDLRQGKVPSLQEPRVDIPAETTPRETGIPEIDNAIRQSEQAEAEIDRLRQQIPQTEEVKQESKQAPKERKIETVNRKGGKKGYYVAETTENGTTRNATPGVVYKTEAEAQEALRILQSGEAEGESSRYSVEGEGKTSTAKVADKIKKSTTPEQKAEAELAEAAKIAERLGLEPTAEEAKADSGEGHKKLADLEKALEEEEAKSKAAYEKAKAKVEGATEKPKNTIASEQKKIDDLMSKKTGRNDSVELENGQVIEKYSMKEMKSIVKDAKENGLPEGFQLDIRYKDGSEEFYSSGDDTSKIKLTNIDSVVWRNDSTDAYAGNNVSIYPDDASNPYWRMSLGETPDYNQKILSDAAKEVEPAKEKTKTVAESKTQNPRYKAPLEGDELTTAKEKVKKNQDQIKLLEKGIEAKQKDKANLWRGKLKKAVAAEIDEQKAEIKKLKAENTAKNKQIKGGVTPIKELLSDSESSSIYSKKNGFLRDINYAIKFAGDTAEAKQLGSKIRTLTDEYLESGDPKVARQLYDKITDLDVMAADTKADYETQRGNVFKHDDYFGTAKTSTGEEYQLRLLDKVLNDKSLENIKDLHNKYSGEVEAPKETPKVQEAPKVQETAKVEEAQKVQEPTKEIPKVKETPKQELPKNEVPKVEKTEAKPKQEVPEVKKAPPKNETPEPPKKENSISKRYDTLMNSDFIKKSAANRKMVKTAKEEGVFNKDVEARAKAQQEAVDEYTKDPESATERNLNRQWDSGKDVDTSMLILHDALDSKSQAYTNLVLLKQAQQAKKAGRQLRAYRDYAGTAEDTLQKAGQYLNDKADTVLSSKKQKAKIDSVAEKVTDGNIKTLSEKFGMDEANVKNIVDAVGKGATKEDVAKMIAMYQATGKTGVSSDALKQLKDIYAQIEKKNLKPNSRARAELEADAFKVLAADIGGRRSLREQWNSWRYLAMLGNPKTHLRNILGNTTHRMVTEAKDNVGAVLEGAIDKANKASGGKGIERTKALLNAKDAGLIKKAALDADDVAYVALNDMGNKYNVKTEIDRARSSFNNKLLSKIDELNSNALDVEDYSALKTKYSRSLARFLKANGADEKIFDATDDASKALLDKGRAYAIDQAKQATFHEYSQLADALTKFSTKLSEGGAASKVGGAVVEGLVPFKKTPINILKQGIKYSPVSLAKAVKTSFDAVKTGNKTATDAIEDLASGLTGTGIMALGAGLAKLGFLTGGANPDYDVDTAETEQGAQNYALKIGDKSYTLDWLAPMSLPLFVGAELNKMTADETDDKKDNADKLISAISTIAEPITEMSMLQGIQNILNELSYSTENVLATFGSNATLGYVSQGIPTLAGQVARTIDDTRRSTYTDKPAGLKRQLDKTWTKIENKIPFLSQTNEPYVDSSGKPQKNEGLFASMLGNNAGSRLLDQTLSPGYYKQGKITAEDKELNRLYKETGEDVYKNVASGKVGDEKLSKKDFTKYQELYGSNTDKLYKAIINSDAYKSMDDAEKVKALKDARSTSKMIADHEIGGKELKQSEQKTYDIYKEKGINGIIDSFKEDEQAKQEKAQKQAEKVEAAGGEQKYAEAKQKADELDMSVDTYLKKEKEYEGGAEQYAEDRKSAKDLGMKPESYNKLVEDAGGNADRVLKAIPELKRNGLANTNAYHVYAHAIQEVPSLTTGEFVRQFNQIDTDNSKGIKQTELLDYINNKGLNDEDATRLWNTYGDWTNKAGERKKIKKGKNGKYTSYY